MVEVMKEDLQQVLCMHCCMQCPNPAAGHHRPTCLLEMSKQSWASLGQSLSELLLLFPGSWSVQGFVCVLQESVSQSYVSSGGSMVG